MDLKRRIQSLEESMELHERMKRQALAEFESYRQRVEDMQLCTEAQVQRGMARALVHQRFAAVASAGNQRSHLFVRLITAFNLSSTSSPKTRTPLGLVFTQWDATLIGFCLGKIKNCELWLTGAHADYSATLCLTCVWYQSESLLFINSTLPNNIVIKPK